MALGLAAFALACGAQPPPKQLLVVTDINFPPYLFEDDAGRLQGILQEKWALWSRRTGVPVRLEGMEWTRAQESVLQDRADVIEALSWTEARTHLYEYSKPYAPIEARVYFHRTVSGINDVASLRGFALGEKAGSACGAWLRERGVEGLRGYATSEALVRAAGQGAVRLFCMDAPTANYYLYKLDFARDFRQTAPLYTTQYHWAVKKGRAELRDFIEKGYAGIGQAELEAIDARWLGNPLRFPLASQYLVYAALVVAALLAAAGLLIAWNRALRGRVAARTAELRDLYDHAPCGYHSLDAEGRIVEINATELAWLGRVREEVIGRHFTEFVTPAGQRTFAAAFPVFKARGAIQDLEYDLVHKDGSTRSVLLSATAQRDGKGGYVRGRSTLYDISETRRAMAALERSEARFRELTELSSDWYWEQDEHLRFVEQVGSHSGDLGVRTEGNFGRTRWEAHADSLAPEQWAAHRAALEAHQPFQDFEYERRSRDGEMRWVSVSGRPFFDREGRFKGYRGVGKDITRRKRAEARFRSAMLNSPIGMAITGPDRRWLEANPALCAMLGRTREELLAMTVDAVMHRDDAAASHARLHEEQARGTESYAVERRFIHADGHVIWTQVNMSLVRDNRGKLQHVVAQMQDVTERKLAAQRELVAKAELELRVAERTAQLGEANKELEAFAYSVSHDLRAPLRAIDRFAQLAMAGAEGKVEPGIVGHLQRVRSGAQRMAQLINDLLQLSRVTRAELHRQPVDLSRLALDIGRELAAADPGRQVALSVAPSMTAHADASLVRILLDNLLRNAWKFTSKRESARIEAGVYERGGEAVFFVRDDGAGFDMEFVDKLFRPFERLHSDKEFPGTGIGLAIVQRIVQRHGGRVWAESAPGERTTFCFTLGR